MSRDNGKIAMVTGAGRGSAGRRPWPSWTRDTRSCWPAGAARPWTETVAEARRRRAGPSSSRPT